MTLWHGTDLHTAPALVQLAAAEVFTLPVDVTDQLYAGETVDTAVAAIITIRDLRTDEFVSGLPAAAWAPGDVLQQVIPAGTLTRNRTYEAVAMWAIEPGNDVRATIVVLEVVA
jgi:hypothetical protein